MKKVSFRELFLSTFYLSAFTFGGGYVMVPLMKKKFADDLKWIDQQEMLDLVAIGQSAPGAIAINTSILIGYKLRGIQGALVALLGTIMPPLIIISTISFFYEAFRSNITINKALLGMQAGVACIIVDVVFKMASSVIKTNGAISIITMILVFIATYIFKINVGFIILVCALSGTILHHLVIRKSEVIK